MRTRSGFTLVEALVVGIIGSIIAGIFIAFMYVHNDVVNSGVAQSILLTQSETVSKTIGTAVRKGSRVIPYNEPSDATAPLSVLDTAIIEVKNSDNTTFALFYLGPQTDWLYEATTHSIYQNIKVFKTGKDTVTTTPNSSFTVSADRKRVTLNLGFRIQYRGKTYTLPPKKDSYLCRN
ncbi:MAG: prepilin-type N-terminal cleavage/methylation domain-containing protein [Chitinispirillaceae bacterium]|nr:prepilin-type N-terminal cleavage/methylation domain-containing protein [Chitinispirillaceae bacterium]